MDAAYDLGLYEELGSSTRAVLEVTIILIFYFEDTGDTPGRKWKDDNEKALFMADFSKSCNAVWSEQHQLVTTNSVPPAQTAGVIFDIQTFNSDDASGHSHWNVKCRKVDAPRWSFTKPGGGGTFTNGEAEWNSLDMTPVSRGGPSTRRTALHEFGHMLGYRDEYPDPSATPKEKALLFTDKHPGDTDSIMYWGETVYPRHYVFFADWISRQWMKKDNKKCKLNDWKVDGLIDMTNARL
jgi:hypothetical protein